jgi:hypothetical protein
MLPRTRACLVITALGLLALPSLAVDCPKEFLHLNGLRPSAFTARDALAELVGPAGEVSLRIRFGHKDRWPGITIKAPQGHWDLSTFAEVVVEVRHIRGERVRFGCRLGSPGPDGSAVFTQATRELGPGEAGTLRVPLRRALPPALAGKLFGMRGYPGGYAEKDGIDTGHVIRVMFFAAQPRGPATVEIRGIRLAGTAERLPTDERKLFPMIDAFGQYLHRDWPGKVRKVEDFARRRAAEAADLKGHPGPEGWDRYGGWKAGPALEATGFFRAARRAGKWWLVDPEGRLFWSHGIDCVRPGAETPITDRKHWFQNLPGRDAPLGQFYGRGRWAPHGYYQGKSYDTYNFLGANLLRKYGSGWQDQSAALAHERLRSWGMNTVGNWSDAKIYLLRKTPYVVTINAQARQLEGSSGYWGKFPDVFDLAFRANLRARMAKEKGTSAGDPWCLGYFVDNELSWGDELSLAVAALASPADQPAKRAFVADLKAKYGTVADLNRAWGTGHASWDALLQSRAVPDRKKAYADLAAFATRTAEQYFRTCREAVKEVAPTNLYLGCRFAWVNDRAVRAAARYCDVISFNLYRDSVADFRLPEGIDKPVIIGEFHFGALDRGLFHPGLRPVTDQRERGRAYARYVRGALANPCLVGTHWFQYFGQATTGRGDGENYQIGFVDVCDTPYPETVTACREVGYGLYGLRAGIPPNPR